MEALFENREVIQLISPFIHYETNKHIILQISLGCWLIFCVVLADE